MAFPYRVVRGAYKEQYGVFPWFLFPRLLKGLGEYVSLRARFSDSRKRLVALATECDVPGADELTMHSPRNLYPSLANQLGWSSEARSKIGRWSGRSHMADHYDRNFCVTELKLRRGIQKKVSGRWRPPWMRTGRPCAEVLLVLSAEPTLPVDIAIRPILARESLQPTPP